MVPAHLPTAGPLSRPRLLTMVEFVCGHPVASSTPAPGFALTPNPFLPPFRRPYIEQHRAHFATCKGPDVDFFEFRKSLFVSVSYRPTHFFENRIFVQTAPNRRFPRAASHRHRARRNGLRAKKAFSCKCANTRRTSDIHPRWINQTPWRECHSKTTEASKVGHLDYDSRVIAKSLF